MGKRRRWVCYLCGKPFTHARLLVTHLMDTHNQCPTR